MSATSTSTTAAGPTLRLGGRLGTIAVIVVTAAVIAAVAWVVDQSTSSTTGVELKGDVAIAAPAIGTPAYSEQSRAMDKRESKKAALLALLRRGPARTWDMMLAGGSGWRSRKQELCEEGYVIHVEEHPDFAIYTLEANP